MMSLTMSLVCLVVFMRTRDTAYLISAGLFWISMNVFTVTKALQSLIGLIYGEEDNDDA